MMEVMSDLGPQGLWYIVRPVGLSGLLPRMYHHKGLEGEGATGAVFVTLRLTTTVPAAAAHDGQVPFTRF